jgi:hypothetical protein
MKEIHRGEEEKKKGKPEKRLDTNRPSHGRT